MPGRWQRRSLKSIMSFTKLISFFKQHWFLVFGMATIAIMTLIPKIPLFDIIPGYIVRARTEDLLVLLAGIIFIVQVFRGKASLKSPLTAIFIFYAVVGILSMLSAVFLVKTLPPNALHISKMFLHYARRLEYFSLFFIFYAAFKKVKDIRIVFVGLCLIMLGVTIYGYGQKYLYWPVYSTMNREFSKGIRLVLTEHARVPSTFGGHYDMAAFSVVILMLILAALFLVKNRLAKLGLLAVFLLGFWLLILASSRSSFLAYLLSVGVLTLLVGIYKQSLWWLISRGTLVLGFSLFIMISFGDLSSRFSQLGIFQSIKTSFAGLLSPVTKQPSDTVAVEPLDKTDQLPIPKAAPAATPLPSATPAVKASPTPLPPDVYVNIPDFKVITSTVGGKTIKQVVEVEREFSPCTYQYGLSACIRFDTLWPRAVRGFVRNPLLGSGYSTLTKGARDEFTEAESTDNDFLRNAGETGVLGLIGYFGPIFILFWSAVKTLKRNQEPLAAAFLIGIIAGSLGLLFNALYIDVFEASKVAFMYWSLVGIAFALIRSLENPAERPASK